MKFSIALRRRAAHITKREKYVPSERAFLDEFGGEYRNAYHAFKFHYFRYSLWTVPLGIMLALTFGLPILGSFFVLFAVTFAYTIGTLGLFGLPFVSIFMGLSIPAVMVTVTVIEVGVAELMGRIPPADRARAAYRRFMWSHRALVRAVVRYNKAHPLLEIVTG